MLSITFLSLALGLVSNVLAFDMSRNDNLAVYWGQDSAGNQQPLKYYCQDDVYDTIPLAFLDKFRSTGNLPEINFGNICDPSGSGTFSGTGLANCQKAMEADIKFCQSKGKAITLSLGGAGASVGFSSDSQAEQFATQIWNLFLGGSSKTRPFGTAVLDGIDLDIENGSPDHYAAFVKKIRSYTDGANKKYYVTAAPQCPFPDAFDGEALNSSPFDAVYVQFYNNNCGLNHPSAYNFATWDNWAKTKSANKDIKVYIGAPGSKHAAGDGYVDIDTLKKYASDAQTKYSSFGGVMLWDASEAYSNDRYDKAIKTSMAAKGKSTKKMSRFFRYD